MRFGRPSGWAAALAGGVAAVAAWARVAPPAALPPPVQPETRDKAPLGAALAGALLLAALVAGWLGYQAWSDTAEREAVARALTGGDPARAADLVARYGCGGCHAIPGLPGADGQVAPPLAGLRKRVFIGGVLRNTADNLVAWIVDPETHSPHSAMPATGITPAEARDVAAYLYAH